MIVILVHVCCVFILYLYVNFICWVLAIYLSSVHERLMILFTVVSRRNPSPRGRKQRQESHWAQIKAVLAVCIKQSKHAYARYCIGIHLLSRTRRSKFHSIFHSCCPGSIITFGHFLLTYKKSSISIIHFSLSASTS